MLQNTKKHFHCHQELSLPGIGSNVLLFLSKRQILEFTNQKESTLEKSGTLSKSASSSRQVVSWRPAGPEESQLRCFIRAGCLHGLLHKNRVPEKVLVELIDIVLWGALNHDMDIWTYGHVSNSGAPTNAEIIRPRIFVPVPLSLHCAACEEYDIYCCLLLSRLRRGNWHHHFRRKWCIS